MLALEPSWKVVAEPKGRVRHDVDGKSGRPLGRGTVLIALAASPDGGGCSRRDFSLVVGRFRYD